MFPELECLSRAVTVSEITLSPRLQCFLPSSNCCFDSHHRRGCRHLSVALSVCHILGLINCRGRRWNDWWRLGLSQILLLAPAFSIFFPPCIALHHSATFQSHRHALKASEGKSHNLKDKILHLNMNTSGFHLRICECWCFGLLCACFFYFFPPSLLYQRDMLSLSGWGSDSRDAVVRWSIYFGTMPVIFVKALMERRDRT